MRGAVRKGMTAQEGTTVMGDPDPEHTYQRTQDTPLATHCEISNSITLYVILFSLLILIAAVKLAS